MLTLLEELDFFHNILPFLRRERKREREREGEREREREMSKSEGSQREISQNENKSKGHKQTSDNFLTVQTLSATTAPPYTDNCYIYYLICTCT